MGMDEAEDQTEDTRRTDDPESALPVDPDDPATVQWRRDASTSRTVRLLWSLGVGTFFAAIGIIVFWRLYDFAGQAGGTLSQSVVLAVVAAVTVTVVALAASSNSEARLEAALESLPVSGPSGSASQRGLSRAIDAAVGTVAMAAVIGALMAVGRVIAQSGSELGGVIGAGLFTGLAAISIPLALVALVLASFLQSVGAVDSDEGKLYLYDPEEAIDLGVIRDASVRRVGDVAVVRLYYTQPDGQYVAGPRRIAVPPSVADEIVGQIRSNARSR